MLVLRSPFFRSVVTFGLTICFAILSTVPPATARETIYVDSLVDEMTENGECSLREAVLSANEDDSTDCIPGDGVDQIEFLVEGVITLSGQLDVKNEVTILGPEDGSVVIDGAGLHRIFFFSDESDFSLWHLTLQNGLGDIGGCVYAETLEVLLFGMTFLGCSATVRGGAVAVEDGDLFTIRSHFEANTAQGDGGAIHVALGSMGIAASSFFNNHAQGANGHGGALYAGGAVEIGITTLHSNSARGSGGALYSEGSGTVELSESTVTRNLADVNVDGTGPDDGGGIYTSGDLTLRSSIVAQNTDSSTSTLWAPDLFVGGTLTSFGGNFVGRNESVATPLPAGLPNGSSDWVGTGVAPIFPDLSDLAARPDGTMSRLPVSSPDNPLIDGGSCVGVVDQRGLTRFVDGPSVRGNSCDIGATELQFLHWDGFETGDLTYWP